ncbi:TonB family protein [Xylophilus rhododendri]|uniref:TonB family protein n=1 Tax=Xylophilus rhododendri TaxID=2697032 RepID=A0A857J115_9BURK|nr:TonB family protein [Xylophilus rhododendri]QHI97396.1 TonB family protein [Xylophilus rhododendri]
MSRHGRSAAIACAVLAASFCGAARAGPPPMNPPPLDFDIPAQDLSAALDAYAGVSGRPALFRSTLVAERRSAALQGRYSPEAALGRLLQGTGLVAQDVGAGDLHTFVLQPAPAAAVAAGATERTPAQVFDAYDGQVQSRLWQAFCQEPLAAPGGYRALLRFGVDGAGRMQRPRLLGSSGSRQRDSALIAVMQKLRVEAPPPAMPQPLTLLILPRGQVPGQDCAGAP